ncbi:MAG: restriction endonuclease subunit S [Acidobacteriota bacterium]
MKNEWPVKRLGDLSDVITKGTTPTSVGHAFVPEGINFVKVESISENGQFIENKLARITQECHNALRRSQLKSGDILFSIAGALGRTAFVTEDIVPANTNQALAIISLRKSDDVSPEFVLKALSTGIVLEQIEKFKGGVAQQNLSLAQVRDFQITLPPLPEQLRIVGILDEAFESIATAKANAEKNLQNARAIFDSHLQSVFTQRGPGWVEKPLGSLASFRNGINYTKDSKGECIKILGVRNFQKNFSAPLDDLDTVTIDGELSALDSLRQDDILAVRSNGNIELIGRCILVGEVTEKISHSGFTIRIRLSNGEVLPIYLCHFMKSASSRKRLTDGGTGTNIKSLNQGMLSAFAIPFPPLSVQNVLVEKLESFSDETRRLESIYQRKLAALEALKKSLLHQAFTGQL